MMRKIGRFLRSWAGVNYRFLRSISKSANLLTSKLDLEQPAVSRFIHLEKNVELKNRHSGQRVFILGTGPSIRAMDLSPLSKELCFSVSNFYKHSQYAQIRPRYHFVPNVFPPQTDESTSVWFQEMNVATRGTEYVLGDLQLELVTQKKIFPLSSTFFLRMRQPTEATKSLSSIDLTQAIPGVQSVPIMCIMAALYMGVKEIYLLGVEHDSLFTSRYDHFYSRADMATKDPHVNADGTLKDSRLDNLESTLNLWRQYADLSKLAKTLDVRIINLTPTSYLDVFPFEKLENVLRESADSSAP